MASACANQPLMAPRKARKGHASPASRHMPSGVGFLSSSAISRGYGAGRVHAHEAFT